MEVDFPIVCRTFSSSGEYRARPSFRDGAQPSAVTLAGIIGNYRFAEPVSCGCAGCSQTHEHGYLLLLSDGSETNTGWDCGLDHFGTQFVAMRLAYDRTEREQPRRQALRELIARGDRFRETIQLLQLRPHGGNWLLRNLRHFEELYPAAILDAVRRHAGQRQVHISEPAVHADPTGPISNIDISIDSATADVPALKTTVRGLRIFTLDTDNWPLFELELELNEFLGLNVDTLASAELTRWMQWAQGLESRLAELEEAIDDGKLFFRRGNLDALQFLVQDQKAREQMAWVVFQSDFIRKTGKQPLKQTPWRNTWRRFLQAINQ